MTEGTYRLKQAKIAICFYGITRSLRYTIESIERNVLSPAKELGDVRIFCHFFDQKYINNPRTGEYGELETEHHLLQPDELILEPPNHCLEQWNFKLLGSFGIPRDADEQSLKNLIHQLHSLNLAFELASNWSPDVYLFCRPDLEYHDNFYNELKETLSRNQTHIKVPLWQQYGGLNDRFAICKGLLAGESYAQRIQASKDYIQDNNQPLHAESLLLYCLKKSQQKCLWTTLRASRIRADGGKKTENFNTGYFSTLKNMIKFKIKTGFF